MKKAKVDWKSLSRKEKWEYIWDYYKIHIIVSILAVCIGVSAIVKIVNHRDPLVGVIMINCEKQVVASEPVFSEFLESNSYEVYSQAVMCRTNIHFWENSESQNAMFSSIEYENSQMIQAYYALLYTREYDVIFGTGPVFEQTVKDGAFADISELLPDVNLELYDGYIEYYTNEETGESYPCAIKLSQENGWIQEHGLYKECSVGVLKAAPHTQIASDMLRYLLAENLEPLTEENP